MDIISKKQDNNDYKQMSYSAYMSGIDPNQLAAAARNAGQGGPTPTINNPWFKSLAYWYLYEKIV